MEDEEPLQTCAVVGQFADAVQNYVDNFFANGVMTTSVVISCVFLTCDQLLRMEKLFVDTSSNLVCEKKNSKNQLSRVYSWNVIFNI